MKQIEQQNKRVSPSPQKGAITERGLFRLMLPSLLGILLCSTCLAGLTWAYFSDSVTSTANTITAATFTVDVTITEITEAETGGEGSLTTTAGAGSTDPSTNGSLASGAGGQEEPPSAESVTAPNTAAKNAEESTLMANVLSMETTAPSTDPPTNEEGDTDTGTGTQQGVTITGKDSTSAADTSGAGPVSQIEAVGKVTFAGANSPNTVSETDTTVNRNEDGSYSLTLTEGNKYTVKLKAIGTTMGYCKVTVNGTAYYTETMDPAMNPAQELVFSIDCSRMTSETTVTITPGWVNSAYPPTEPNQINNGTTIGTPTTGANTTEQSASAAVKMDESPSEVTVRLNKQITAEQTRGEETITADEPTCTISEEQPEKQSEEQPEKQPEEQPEEQPEKQQEEQPEEQSEKQSEE